MTTRRICAAALGLAALGLALPLHAGVLFNTLGNAEFQLADAGLDQWVADSFATDNHSYLLTDAILYLLQDSSTSGSVTAYLYSSQSGPEPNAPLESLGTISDIFLPTDFKQAVFFGGNNYLLAPNTMYWIVLTGTTDFDAAWQQSFVGGTGVAGQYWAATSSGIIFSSAPDSMFGESSMEVDATLTTSPTSAPEPGPGACVLAGLAGLGILRRRGAVTR